MLLDIQTGIFEAEITDLRYWGERESVRHSE